MIKGGTSLDGGGKTGINLCCSEDQSEEAPAGPEKACPSLFHTLLLSKLVNVPDMSQPRPRYVVDRAAYSLSLFDDEFEKKDRTYPVGEKLRNTFR